MPRVPDLPCAQCGKLMWRSKSSLPEGEATCLPCRRSGNGPFKHGIRAYDKRGCRCDVCRAAKAAQTRRFAKRFREQHGFSPSKKYRPATKLTRKCRRCGKGKVMRDLCSRCQVARAARQRVARRKAERAAAGTAGPSGWPWVQGVCAWCREPFVRKGMASPYCSRECNRKDNPKSGFISRSGRLAIYERDNWTCQLCFEPVDPNLHYLDDWAASLDHIVPQSHMLVPDHSPSNLRLAHRWCNSVRGDESHECASIFAA